MQSTEKEEPSVTPATNTQLHTDTQLSKYFQNIFELPLVNFENCLVNSNLSALVIAGFPKPEELARAWENILSEYHEALGQADYKMYLNLYKAIKVLEVKYSLIKDILIAGLRKTYSKYLCDELNEWMRTSFKFDITNTDNYFKDLDRCEKRTGAMKIALDMKRIEFVEIDKKFNKGEGEKPHDRNYFTSVLVILSKHNGYRITRDIFVNEYCEYLRQFNLWCDKENSK